MEQYDLDDDFPVVDGVLPVNDFEITINRKPMQPAAASGRDMPVPGGDGVWNRNIKQDHPPLGEGGDEPPAAPVAKPGAWGPKRSVETAPEPTAQPEPKRNFYVPPSVRAAMKAAQGGGGGQGPPPQQPPPAAAAPYGGGGGGYQQRGSEGPPPMAGGQAQDDENYTWEDYVSYCMEEYQRPPRWEDYDQWYRKAYNRAPAPPKEGPGGGPPAPPMPGPPAPYSAPTQQAPRGYAAHAAGRGGGGQPYQSQPSYTRRTDSDAPPAAADRAGTISSTGPPGNVVTSKLAPVIATDTTETATPVDIQASATAPMPPSDSQQKLVDGFVFVDGSNNENGKCSSETTAGKKVYDREVIKVIEKLPSAVTKPAYCHDTPSPSELSADKPKTQYPQDLAKDIDDPGVVSLSCHETPTSRQPPSSVVPSTDGASCCSNIDVNKLKIDNERRDNLIIQLQSQVNELRAQLTRRDEVLNSRESTIDNLNAKIAILENRESSSMMQLQPIIDDVQARLTAVENKESCPTHLPDIVDELKTKLEIVANRQSSFIQQIQATNDNLKVKLDNLETANLQTENRLREAENTLTGKDIDVHSDCTSSTIGHGPLELNAPSAESHTLLNKAVLGRPCQIGSIYNIWTDTFEPTYDGWDDGQLQASATRSFSSCPEMPVVLTEVKNTTTSANLDALSIDPDLKLSILCGLTKPPAECAAAYITDIGMDDTVSDVLKMSAVQRGCEIIGCQQDQVMDKARQVLATSLGSVSSGIYVVTGIEYGAEAFFVCNCNAQLSYQDAATVTDAILSQFRHIEGIDFDISTSAAAINDANEPQDVNAGTAAKISVRIYSDINSGQLVTPQSPVSLEEASRFLKEFAVIVKHPTNLIPKRVFLSPLVKLAQLNSTTVASLHSVTSSIMDRVRGLLEKLQLQRTTFPDSAAVVAKIKSTNNNEVVSSAYDACSAKVLKEDVGQLVNISHCALKLFDDQMGDILVKVRKGEAKESKLTQFLSYWEESAMARPAAITLIFDSITTTASHLQNMLNNAAIVGIKVVTEGELRTMFQKPVCNVACLCINEAAMASNNVANMLPVLSNDGTKWKQLLVPEWHHYPNVMHCFEQVGNQFFAYAKDNQSEKVPFVICFTHDPHRTPGECAFVVVYHKETRTRLVASRPITLPGPPESAPRLVPSSLHPNGLIMEWDSPVVAPGYVRQYVIKVMPVDDTNSGGTIDSDSIGTTFTIDDLEPDTKYTFAVASVTIGDLISGFGPVSEVIETPQQRLAIKTLQSSRAVRKTNRGIDIRCPAKKFTPASVTSIGLQKVEFGNHSNAADVKEKVILIMGANASETATFLNNMANVLYGVRIEDNFRFQINEGDDEYRDVTAYTFHDTILPYSLTVISAVLDYFDDPSLIIKPRFQLEMASVTGIDQLDAICFIVKRDDDWAISQLKHNINAAISVFGPGIPENIFLFSQYCDATKRLDQAVGAAEIPHKTIFKFNNMDPYNYPGFFYEDAPERIVVDWQINQDSFEGFFNNLETLVSRKVLPTAGQDMNDERKELQNGLEEANIDIKTGLADLDLVSQEYRVLEKFNDKLAGSTSFMYGIVETRIEKDILEPDCHSSICLKCNRTCSSKCGMQHKDPQEQHCRNIHGGQYCSTCPPASKCHWSDHKTVPYLVVSARENVIKSAKDIRAKYAKEDSDHSDAQKVIDVQFVETFYQLFHRIERANGLLNALREKQSTVGQSASINQVDHTDMLIRAEEQDAQPGVEERVDLLSLQKTLAAMIQDSKDPKFNLSTYGEWLRGMWDIFFKN